MTLRIKDKATQAPVLSERADAERVKPIRLNVDLDPDDYQALSDIAHVKRLKMAQIARELLLDYIERNK